MPNIDPSPVRFRALRDAVPAGMPVTMLNLLKFREQADYQADVGEPARSGREAYRIYAALAIAEIERVGGRVVWSGKPVYSLVGSEDEQWDEVLLVRYPSAAVFMDMVRSPAYQRFTYHRTAALADARLVAMQAETDQ